MTGYEEILTDRLRRQIITFTFPTSASSRERGGYRDVNLAASAGALGAIFHAESAKPRTSRHKAARRLAAGARNHRPDRRRHARADAMIRESGMPMPSSPYPTVNSTGRADRPGEGLAGHERPRPGAGSDDGARFDWTRRAGFRARLRPARRRRRLPVVAIDYGIKRNILRLLSDCGCAVTSSGDRDRDEIWR